MRHDIICPICGKNVYITEKYNDCACEDINCLLGQGFNNLTKQLHKVLENLKEDNMNKCSHKHPNGNSAIEYCSTYEMRSSDMYCVICNRQGSEKYLINDGEN